MGSNPVQAWIFQAVLATIVDMNGNSNKLNRRNKMLLLTLETFSIVCRLIRVRSGFSLSYAVIS